MLGQFAGDYETFSFVVFVMRGKVSHKVNARILPASRRRGGEIGRIEGTEKCRHYAKEYRNCWFNCKRLEIAHSGELTISHAFQTTLAFSKFTRGFYSSNNRSSTDYLGRLKCWQSTLEPPTPWSLVAYSKVKLLAFTVSALSRIVTKIRRWLQWLHEALSRSLVKFTTLKPYLVKGYITSAFAIFQRRKPDYPFISCS